MGGQVSSQLPGEEEVEHERLKTAIEEQTDHRDYYSLLNVQRNV
jgi:hypothetical protein